jgi:hypothetical protein
MKYLIAVGLFLTLAITTSAFTPEKIVVVDGVGYSSTEIPAVQSLLNVGWTVKAVTADGAWNRLVFVLSPPTKEVQAELREQRQAEFQKKLEAHKAAKLPENP